MSFADKLFGKRLRSSQAEEERIGVWAGIPILGLDGLSSSAYGPEAALTLLVPLGAAGLATIGPITLVILGLLLLLYLSYRQTIGAYPQGGGSYTVAKENLGTRVGLVAAAALMIDYILNVAVGISAGVAALVSAVPALHRHILLLCLAILAVIVIVNLRGTRDPGLAFGLPTYLFIASLGMVLVAGVIEALLHGGHPRPVTPPPRLGAPVEAASLWILMRSFASGCTAMTGVEAVSNGVKYFKKPTVPNAQRTLTAIVAILGLLLGGIAYLARAYHIGAMDQEKPGYQSVLSQLVAAVAGRGVIYYVTIGSILAVLALSANTSFADFPRLCRIISVTVVLVPVILVLFARVKRHYGKVLRQVTCLRPLDLSDLEPPIVVVPVDTWNMVTAKALRFGLRISSDVRAVHVGVNEAKRQALQEQWQLEVEEPARREGRPAPQLIVLPSPYRRLFLPLIDFVQQLEKKNPAREIAVIIPELVERRWYETLLHNHRAEVLKARLLLEDSERVALINIPWYLK